MNDLPDKVFISYSWSSPEHKEWVMELATRLTDDNVDVVIDDWDTEEGQDLNKFMERMVNDHSIDKVLVICDKIYAEKADGRLGGVGTETTIASEEVYKNADQKKFFAIVTEMDENGRAYLPTFLKGKKYINMATPQDYEEGYKKLVRNLYHKPEYQRPKKGSAPQWLLNDEKKSLFKSTLQLKGLKHTANSRPNKLDNSFKLFISAFYEDYSSFVQEYGSESNHYKLAYENFQEMIDLRNIYIEAIDSYVTYSDTVSAKLLIIFFEGIYPLITRRINTQRSFYESQFDHMKMFVSELVIYTMAILLHHEEYPVIGKFITNHYITFDEVGREVDGKINIFQFHPQVLMQYIRNSGEKISPIGDLLLNRSTYPEYPFAKIVEAELLIYMLSYFYRPEDKLNVWFPFTTPYIRRDRIPFIRRLRSKAHFEEVKDLFNVNTESEMKEMLELFFKHFKEMDRFRVGGLPYTFLLVDPDEIGKY